METLLSVLLEHIKTQTTDTQTQKDIKRIIQVSADPQQRRFKKKLMYHSICLLQATSHHTANLN